MRQSLTRQTISYASSADGAGPLLADAVLVPDGRAKPLLAVMHGYGGSKGNVARDVLALAPKGVVALAPDMRGKGKSAGRWDSGGLDVLDILDAVLAAVRAFPGEVDARNLNIVGYSGGGGNAIACAVRFPDLFQTAASFFGIADYAWWHRHGGRPDCKAAMEEVLGGGPEAEPELYAARNAVPAAANALARMHFLWDAEEKQCPPLGVEDFLSAYERAGGSRATRHVSRPGDAQRWLHGYRTDHADIGDPADALFLPDVLAPKAASPQLPERGRLVVPGYLVTRRFAVWIGEAKSGDVRGRVTVEYDLSGGKPVVEVVENPGNYQVSVEASPLAGLG
jgi:pimeloyl-ACP methyl ester carboxylesterase